MVEERRRAQHGAQRHTDRLEERPPFGQQRPGEAGVGLQLAVPQRPAERTGGERRDDVDDVVVGILRKPDLPLRVELDAREQLAGAGGRPRVEERPLDGHRLQGDALPLVVPDKSVRLEIQIGVVVRRRLGVGQRRADEVAGTQERRDLHRARRVAHQIERADELVQRRRRALREPAIEGQGHRRLRLVGIGLDGDAIAAGPGHVVALRHRVEQERRGDLGERGVAVAQLLDRAPSQDLRVADEFEPLRVHVLDDTPFGRRPRAEGKRRIESAIGRVQIGPHVQRRHALVGRYRVEPARIGFRRQAPAQGLPDRLVDAQQVGDGVGVLEPGEPPQRRALSPARREVGVDQRPLQRPERRLDHRGVGSCNGGGRHLPVLHPLVDPLPRAIRRAVGQVEPEARQVERRHRAVTVTCEAGRLDERRHFRFERLRRGLALARGRGRCRGRDATREEQREARATQLAHRAHHLRLDHACSCWPAGRGPSTRTPPAIVRRLEDPQIMACERRR